MANRDSLIPKRSRSNRILKERKQLSHINQLCILDGFDSRRNAIPFPLAASSPHDKVRRLSKDIGALSASAHEPQLACVAKRLHVQSRNSRTR
jgi:hypothetical protein